MLWDNNYLYVFAVLNEPHIWADLKQRDTVIFYNNDFEVFIDPSGTTFNYAEFEVNALGTEWDLLLDRPYRSGGKANNNWNPVGLKSAVKIFGSLNDPSDIDSCWTVEMAIPMNALIELKDHPKSIPVEGEKWRVNFSRVEWDFDLINGRYSRKKKDGKYLPEYNWVWSNQKAINMHEPEKWGFVQFTEKDSNSNTQYVLEKDLLYKQALFAIFRKIRFGEYKYLLQKHPKSEIRIRTEISPNNSVFCTYLKTLAGFEIGLRIPKSNTYYIINEMGWLSIKK